MLISWYYTISWHSTKTTQNILETQALRFSGSNKTSLHFIFCMSLENQWASLVAHLVKNLPAMLENLVQLLGRKGPLEKG